MEQFIINGPAKLIGTVKISGAKNSALPIIAASCLVDGVVTLFNVPKIKDVITLLEIIEDLGGSYKIKKNSVEIDASKIRKTNPDAKKIKHLRASILLISPLLLKNKQVKIAYPGGCLIGTRPIDIHLSALEKMGAEVIKTNNFYDIKAKKLKPTKVYADFSVTGTENIIMAAVLTRGTTQIKLAAAEPHVQDLCHFLNKCGAKIEGVGTHSLTIKGVAKLRPCKYKIISDQIESGTFAIAAAATGGNVTIKGFDFVHHDALISKFYKANIKFKKLKNKVIQILPSSNLKNFNLRTEVYPGFPTDLQAPMAVLATQCKGESSIHETIFEGRLGYIAELSKMGANAAQVDIQHAKIIGPTKLNGTRITSFDLRAGATLIIAALVAKGESRIDQIEIIDRGYEKIEEKLKALGADIKRIELKEIER